MTNHPNLLLAPGLFPVYNFRIVSSSKAGHQYLNNSAEHERVAFPKHSKGV